MPDAASPFVQVESQRSKVVATIDFDEAIDADTLVRRLSQWHRRCRWLPQPVATSRTRACPAIDLADTEALTRRLDYCIERGPTGRRLRAHPDPLPG